MPGRTGGGLEGKYTYIILYPNWNTFGMYWNLKKVRYKTLAESFQEPPNLLNLVSTNLHVNRTFCTQFIKIVFTPCEYFIHLSFKIFLFHYHILFQLN